MPAQVLLTVLDPRRPRIKEPPLQNWWICADYRSHQVTPATRAKSVIWLTPWPPTDYCFRRAANHGEAKAACTMYARRDRDRVTA